MSSLKTFPMSLLLENVVPSPDCSTMDPTNQKQTETERVIKWPLLLNGSAHCFNSTSIEMGCLFKEYLRMMPEI